MTSAKGSCMCGDFTYEFPSVDLYVTSTCHCLACRKLASPSGCVMTIIKAENFKHTSGSAKHYTRGWSDTGRAVHYTSCDKCSTPIWIETETLPGMKLIRTGTLDEPDELCSAAPVSEIYTKHRPNWCPAVEGAKQAEAGPESDV